MTEKFYALEGLDATGKSSVIEGLRKNGFEVFRTPPLVMEEYRKSFENANVDTRYLFYLSGVMCVGKDLEKYGGVVDRYILTTVAAHEAMGSGLIESTMPVLLSVPRPENTILLTAREEVRMNRLMSRGANENDIKNLQFNTQILEGYRKWAERLGHKLTEVDTSELTLDEVIKKVISIL